MLTQKQKQKIEAEEEYRAQVREDRIVRSIFLNLEIDEEKVTNSRLKEPFETLLNMKRFPSGGDGGNRTRVRKIFLQNFYKLI